MAKTYTEALKYLIRTTFEIKGVVDKPDIIGAVFGQSEGLLGEDMDLKELQEKGKIGRIEVNFSQKEGMTFGEILIPSSMDMVQTSLLAALLEAVEKVGPCDSKFVTKNIDDTRENKRKEIAERAKSILSKFRENVPETMELTKEIKDDLKVGELEDFGKDKLPAGPGIREEDSIIVVEGRADVIALLKHGIKNVIGMNGSKIPETIVELSKSKKVTLFVDGDRGGLLNARKFHQMANIEYVAVAPDGKEVEELTRKECLIALKKKMSIHEFEDWVNNKISSPEATMERHSPTEYSPHGMERTMESSRPEPAFQPEYSERNTGFERRETRPTRRPTRSSGFGRERRTEFHPRSPRTGFPTQDSDSGFGRRPRESGFDSRPPRGRMRGGRSERMGEREQTGGMGREFSVSTGREFSPASGFGAASTLPSAEETSKFQPIMQEVKGKLAAELLDDNMKKIKEIPIRELVDELQKTKGVHAIVFDGIVTKRLVDEAAKQGVKYVVGMKKGKIENNSDTKVLTME